GHFFGGHFVAERLHHLGARAHENDVFLAAAAGQGSIFAQEAVAGVDGVGAVFLGYFDNAFDVEAELHYVGSITIDEDLLDAANMVENEKVTVVNVNNGERLETYTIRGERGTGTICLNGPAARRVAVGDVIIV
nr:hypothetical protein F511_25201 [Tanacetum cinerariifolium]